MNGDIQARIYSLEFGIGYLSLCPWKWTRRYFKLHIINGKQQAGDTKPNHTLPN
jgi:hypothetical protein